MVYVFLRFGKHLGRSLEWLAFHDPGYLAYMQANNIVPSNMPEHFEEVLIRADNLAIPGICLWCKVRPITRLCLHRHRASGGIGAVGFDCDECQPTNNGWTMMRPSFLAVSYYKSYDKTGGEILVNAIKAVYFGSSHHRITEKRAQEFFENPTNFTLTREHDQAA